MSKNLNLLALLSLYLISTGTAAHALSCRSGDSSCSDQSATDCTALGYSTANVSNCKHYLYCPFNINYKTCVAFSEEEPTPPESDCPKGYAEDVKDCGIQGANGWMLRPRFFLEDYNKCRECIARPCFKGKTEITSQADCKNGETYSATGYYSGDQSCGKCTAASCSDGYAKDVKYCGTQGANGWTLGTKDANGCGECIAKACPGDSEINKTCDAGYKQTDTGSYSGDKKCYQCTATTCSDGYAKDVKDCGTQGANGWTLGTKDANNCGECTPKACPGDSEINKTCGAGYKQTDTGSYSGDKKCYQCTDKPCPSGTSTTPNCSAGYKQSETGDISGNNKCYTCISVCPAGYTYGLTAAKCGTTGETGWIVETKDGCGKCKEKTCGDHGLTTYKSTIPFGSLCKTKEVYLGNSLNKCQDCIYCEDSGVTNPYNLPYTQYKNCKTVCSATDSAQDIYKTYVYYTAYEANGVTTKDGKTGSCFGWVNTEGVDGSCCCYDGDAVALADCSVNK